MLRPGEYYEPSGQIGFMGPLYMLLAGVVGALFAGVVYGYLIYYNGIIISFPLMSLALGWIVGIFVGVGAKFGKARNSGVRFIFGLFCGLLAEYVGLVSWTYMHFNQEIVMLSPSNLLQALEILSEDYLWSFLGIAPKGIWLHILWIVEAVLIVGTSAFAARWALSTLPYCELCDRWIEHRETVSPLDALKQQDKLIEQLELGNLETLKLLTKREHRFEPYTILKLSQCSSCQKMQFLTILSVEVRVIDTMPGYSEERAGKKFKRFGRTIVDNLMISPEDYHDIKDLWIEEA